MPEHQCLALAILRIEMVPKRHRNTCLKHVTAVHLLNNTQRAAPV
jgi:hypothetical protein